MSLSVADFEKILKITGYFNNRPPITKMEQDIAYKEFNLSGMDYDQVYAIINGARKKRIWETEGKAHVNIKLLDLIRNMCNQTDIEVYNQIHNLDKHFKSYYLERRIKTPKLDKLISKCLRVAKKINGAVNTEVLTIAEEDFSVLHNIASIYTSISEHTENKSINRPNPNYNPEVDDADKKIITYERISDYIVGDKIGKLEDLKDLKDAEISQRFDEFLKELDNPKIEASECFTQQDIADLLEHTTTIIGFGTAYKVQTLREVITLYKEHISKLADATETDRKQISQVTTKFLLKKAGSILQNNYIKDSIDFLLGKEMKACFDDVEVDDDENKKSLRSNFPNLRLQGMTAKKHIHMLKNHPSILRQLVPSTMNTVATSLTNCVYKALELGDAQTKKTLKSKIKEVTRAGFDINTMFGADNLWELFQPGVVKIFNGEENGVEQQNIVKNMKTLLKFVSIQDMQKIMQHNFLLLVKDNAEVEKKLYTILKNSKGDVNVFRDAFSKYVNSKFKLKKPANASDEQTEAKTKNEFIKVNKEKIVIDDFNFENFPEFAVSLLLTELEQVNKYAQLSKSKSMEFFTSSKSSIAHDLAGARLGVYFDREEDFKDNPKKFGMNLRLLANKNKFNKKLNRLITTCEGLEKDENNKTKKEKLIYALSKTRDVIENLITKVSADLEENSELTDDFYRDEKTGKKARNSGIDFKEEVPKAQTLIEWMGNRKSFVSRVVTENSFQQEVDNILEAQAKAGKYSQERGEMHQWYEHRYVLLVELEYLQKLHKALTSCESYITPKKVEEETEQKAEQKAEQKGGQEVEQEDELIGEDVKLLDEEGLLKRKEHLEGRIYNKEKQIRGKYGRVSTTITSPHGKALLKTLKGLEDELEEVNRLLEQLRPQV